MNVPQALALVEEMKHLGMRLSSDARCSLHKSRMRSAGSRWARQISRALRVETQRRDTKVKEKLAEEP